MNDFPWLNDDRTKDPTVSTRSMREDELRRRAGLLATLGYTKAEAEARLRANALWECEGLGKPVALKKLGSIVNEAFTKAGVAEASRGKTKR